MKVTDITRLAFPAVAWILPPALAVAVSPHGDHGLHSLIHARGKGYFGTATDPKYFNETEYINIISNRNEWGQITPENSLKFDAVQPQRGVWNFTDGDEMVDWSVSQGHLVRCHNLIWHNGLPEWLSSGNWTREELLDIMEEHIEKVVTHYRGRCYAWDVVNEVLDHETGDLRSTLWLDTIGEEYIDIAFELAAKYDPEAKLYYNDYGIESKNEKSLAATELVRQLKSRGVKVDGVGLQAHFPVILAPTYDEQVENLGRFGELGVDVAYTELDVFIDMPNDPQKTQVQADIFADTVKACLDTEACVGITLWGFYDAFSWVWEGVPGFGDPHLWWANYTQKPSYFAIEEVLLK